MDDDQRRLKSAMRVSTLEAVSWMFFLSVLLATPFWLGRYYLLALFYASFTAVFLRLAQLCSWKLATVLALAIASAVAAVMNIFWQGI